MTALFLCTGNSCRSQMIEGLARTRWGEDHRFYSAGVEAHGLNRRAVQVMSEIGIDISSHESKVVETLSDIDFDLVITVCGHAHESCPAYLKGGNIIHRGFPDPAKAKGSEDEILAAFRAVRDELKLFVEKELAELLSP
ncbi:MAG: arsenate reductase ArsC [Spirochaetota bacterium]|nr:arsenate reductase ArsC [Spirochaetota bacterium]